MSAYKTGLAFTSLFLGFISLVLPIVFVTSIFGITMGHYLIIPISFITAILGITMGHIARSRAYQFPYQYGGSGIALWGVLLSYLSVLFSLFLLGAIIFLHLNDDLIPLLNTIDPTEKTTHYVLPILNWVPFMYPTAI